MAEVDRDAPTEPLPPRAGPAAAPAAAPVTLDAIPPPEIARKVESLGVAKARTDTVTLLALSVLAGAFISLGAILFLVVVTGSPFGFGPTRLLGGASFCLGLVLVVVAGAELFTGNNLVAIAWASRRIRFEELLRNWGIVYVGNAIGCIGTALLVAAAGTDAMLGGEVGNTAMRVAEGKVSLSPLAAFTRGILCNALVCLAVWLALGGRSVFDKIAAVFFPVTAFVAMGFEHSIANWTFLSYALMLDGEAPGTLTTASPLTVGSAATSLVWVTLGNIIGGTLLVAGVYWIAYLRPEKVRVSRPTPARARR